MIKYIFLSDVTLSALKRWNHTQVEIRFPFLAVAENN